MVKVATKLDYNLQAYQERLGLVNFLVEQGELDGYPPGELDKVANYLLYAEDVDAEVELKEGSKHKISYEELMKKKGYYYKLFTNQFVEEKINTLKNDGYKISEK